MHLKRSKQRASKTIHYLVNVILKHAFYHFNMAKLSNKCNLSITTFFFNHFEPIFSVPKCILKFVFLRRMKRYHKVEIGENDGYTTTF